MSNKVLQGIAFNNEVRFFIADSTELVNTIHQKTNSLAVASAAMGRSATISGLMGLMLKGDEAITTIIKGDGPIGQIITIADSHGVIRTTCSNPHVEIPLKANGKLDVSGAIGTNGMLRVVKNLNLKEPFVSEVPLISGEVAEDYTYYFSSSEQIPTAISAGVLVDVDYTIRAAGALIIQLMPNASDDTIDKLEKSFYNLPPISSLLCDLTVEEILATTFGDDFSVLKESSLEYKCNCYEEKFIDSIRLVEMHELIEIKCKPTVECICSFCNEKYTIDTDKL